MRRLTGTYDGTEYVLLEYDTGLVECPSNLVAVLQERDGALPTGEALEDACRVLFGESFRAREV